MSGTTTENQRALERFNAAQQAQLAEEETTATVTEAITYDSLNSDQQYNVLTFLFNALFADLEHLMTNGLDDEYSTTLGFASPEEFAAWQARSNSAYNNGSSIEDIARDIPDYSSFDFDNTSRSHLPPDLAAAAPLLDMIAVHESGGDYNIIAGGRRIDLTNMTIDEVLDWQERNNPPGLMTAAAGRYQIINSTLEGLKSSMGLSGDEKFDEAMQDRMAIQLMRQRGLNDYLDGDMPESKFMRKLSQEWASLPKDMGGRSYYDGDGVNAAHQSPEAVLAAMREARAINENPNHNRPLYADNDAPDVSPNRQAFNTGATSSEPQPTTAETVAEYEEKARGFNVTLPGANA